MKIQLKRSNVLEGGKAKPPIAAQMEYGEIAVNYNTTDATLFIKDSANGIIRFPNSSSVDSLQAEIDGIKVEIDIIQAAISDIQDDVDAIEAAIVIINDRLAAIELRLTNIEVSINTIEGDIQIINGKIDDINDVLPDPLQGNTHQPNTLDERYVSRFSWSDIPSI